MTDVLITAGELAEFLTKEPSVIIDTRNPEAYGAGHLPGICLYERRIGGADILVRFPRDWLSDWRMVAGTLDRLIASVLASP